MPSLAEDSLSSLSDCSLYTPPSSPDDSSTLSSSSATSFCCHGCDSNNCTDSDSAGSGCSGGQHHQHHHHQHHHHHHHSLHEPHHHLESLTEPEVEKELPELNNVQLEVTMRLLEGEKRRLRMLHRELESCLDHPDTPLRDLEVLKQNIQRIENQFHNLDEEYRVSCKAAFIRRSLGNKKTSRSQPAIGVKQTAKPRVSAR
ncbi:transcription factor MafAa [Aplysia californica]|uniref:Transcription factor MafAa n=1 Tax=Aplysia californica TaxID=6500 RepID=A0ABM1VUA7_APLCA|nr:transcription factor MafAa [Aplysia californica]